jgi:XTP/dITP diphosphohydrolase
VIRLLLATRNAGKVRELEPLLRDSELDVELETLADHPEVADVDEGWTSFDENARLKATFAAQATGLWALGEDSGLEVHALYGMPGVLSARYALGHGDSDAPANNSRLLRELEGIADRRARFVCVCALARPDGEVAATAQGTCEGTITNEPRGEGGFGYDPCFVPDGEKRTMAELPLEEKGAISHRGRALRALLPELKRHLG